MYFKNYLWKSILSFLLLIPVAFLPYFAVSEASGQDFPSRPVKIVVPFAAGGVSTVIWRSIADPMSKVLGQPVVIENKPGGGMSLAYTLVANSKPDGYTTGAAPINALTNTYLAFKVAYHPIKNFVHIGGIWRYNEVFAIKADARWKNWQSFYDYVKKNPNQVKVGFSNPIGSGVVTMKWIAKKNNLVWNEVTFTSEAECITALLGGHIDAFVGAGVVHTLLRDGRGRAILAITLERVPDYPEVPTAYELYKINAFNAAGLVGPAGIPKKIVKKLEAALYEGTKSPEYIATIKKMGAVVRWRNGEEFTQDVKEIYATQKELLKSAGLLRKEAEKD